MEKRQIKAVLLKSLANNILSKEDAVALGLDGFGYRVITEQEKKEGKYTRCTSANKNESGDFELLPDDRRIIKRLLLALDMEEDFSKCNAYKEAKDRFSFTSVNLVVPDEAEKEKLIAFFEGDN